MENIIKILFWASLFTILYCYLLYPLTLGIINVLRGRRGLVHSITPSVTIVIAAYNEAKVIRENIANKLALDYPAEKLEIMVVSDASDDGTDDIVNEFSGQGVRLIRQAKRSGKTAAVNRAVSCARGEIICFADANSIWDRNALLYLVRNFADEKIGYVTGKMVYTTSSGNMVGDGCSAYMRYENWLRALETEMGSIVGVDGGIDAVRKRLYEPMKPELIPDFILPLKVVEKGYRVVYEPKALLREESLDNSKDEFKMRKRVTLRALHALMHMKRLLNPLAYGLFSYQLFTHKLLRYFIWIFMATAFATNLILLGQGQIYKMFALAQVIFYVFVALGAITENRGIKLNRFIFIPYYFFILNLSCAIAFFKFLKRDNAVIWEPRKG